MHTMQLAQTYSSISEAASKIARAGCHYWIKTLCRMLTACHQDVLGELEVMGNYTTCLESYLRFMKDRGSHLLDSSNSRQQLGTRVGSHSSMYNALRFTLLQLEQLSQISQKHVG